MNVNELVHKWSKSPIIILFSNRILHTNAKQIALFQERSRNGKEGSFWLYMPVLLYFQIEPISSQRHRGIDMTNTLNMVQWKQTSGWGLIILILLSDRGPQMNSKCRRLCPKGKKGHIARKGLQLHTGATYPRNGTVYPETRPAAVDWNPKTSPYSRWAMCLWCPVPARESPLRAPKAKWPWQVPRTHREEPQAGLACRKHQLLAGLPRR